ncbi:MAG: Holliday junction resolvase RuvX [Planctomycetota bacterium]
MNLSGTVAAIDYGRRRIGIAAGDTLGISTRPLAQLEVRDMGDAVAQAARVIKEAQVALAVVGLPANMDGTEGPMAREARDFAARLAAAAGIPCEMFDEQLTSYAADEALNALGVPGHKRKGRRDVKAAQIILRAWLDART